MHLLGFFGVGIATSIGPCAAPRYIAVTALAQRGSQPWRTAALFAGGAIVAYVALGTCFGALAALRSWSTIVDAGLAATLGIAGVMTLLHDDDRGHHAHTAAPARAGTVAAWGAASALVMSPCCAPIVAAIAGAAATGARFADGAVLVFSFAAGHVLPLTLAVPLGSKGVHWLLRADAARAGAAVSGSLMIALAGFYGLLA